MTDETIAVEDQARPLEGFSNALGVWTLYTREVRRFIKVYTQTLMAPVVTTLLFLAVFALVLGERASGIAGVPFLEFLAPGLVMMSVAQNAFSNTSSSIVISKVQGNIVDTLMPPLTPHELTLAICMGGATRGIMVGFVVAVAMMPFVDLSIHSLGFVLYHGVMAALMLSLLGTIGGIWAEKFDQIAAVTNFLVTPLTFLSGTFYSIHRLPEAVQTVAFLNPFFYMIDGFRYGFIGQADSEPLLGVAIMAGINAGLWLVCRQMFASGYRLKT